jgi:hypothetical protein
MLKKSVSLIVAALLLNAVVCVQSASAESKEEKQARFTEKVKTGINKLGASKDSIVEVKLRDKTGSQSFNRSQDRHRNRHRSWSSFDYSCDFYKLLYRLIDHFQRKASDAAFAARISDCGFAPCAKSIA